MAEPRKTGQLFNTAKNEAMEKAVKVYNDRADTPASKKVKEDIALLLGSVTPIAAFTAPVRAGVMLYKKAGIDKLMKHLIQAYNPGASKSAQATSRAILNSAKNKNITKGKNLKPFSEIKTPVQRPKSVRAAAAREKLKQAAQKNKTGSTPKTPGQLSRDIKGRTIQEGKTPKDTTKIQITPAMQKEARRVKASMKGKPSGKKIATNIAKVGAGGTGTYLATKDNEEKRYGGKVKRNMGGRVRGVGQAVRGFGKAKYSDKMY